MQHTALESSGCYTALDFIIIYNKDKMISCNLLSWLALVVADFVSDELDLYCQYYLIQ